MQLQDEPQSATFLSEHTLATLSTVNNDGKVHGAVVYYVSLGQNDIYFMSKTGTTKITNIEQHPQVAFTIFDASLAQTLQISAKANIETDPNTKQIVIDNIIKTRPYSGEMLMPPVTALSSGEYVVVHLLPDSFHFSDYRQELIDNRNV